VARALRPVIRRAERPPAPSQRPRHLQRVGPAERPVDGERLGELSESASGEFGGVGHTVDHDNGMWRSSEPTEPERLVEGTVAVALVALDNAASDVEVAQHFGPYRVPGNRLGARKSDAVGGRWSRRELPDRRVRC